ncbi:MAG TPA: NADH-quinone oxidoreductase subunit L [Nocardioidaceae bacterium]|nr:NADH-quinone oxidoreductase subunit L [Nocardioidaceae bacterium]
MIGLTLVIVLPALAALVGLAAIDGIEIALVSVGGAAITFVATLIVAVPRFGTAGPVGGSWGHAWGTLNAPDVSFALRADSLSAALLLLAASVALLVQIYSVAYLADDPRYRAYASIVSLFSASMAAVVVADDMFVLLIGWEMMGVCSYLLIAHYWERSDARDGAAKAFLMTRTADVGLLIAIIVLGQAVGSYRISDVLDAVAAGDLSGSTITVTALLILLAAIGKSAQFPLHTWLPDAMPGPAPISALIHSATMVAAGVYLVARMEPLFLASETATIVLGLTAVITMLIAAAFALAQDDLKRVLAWSTVSQLAYMFAALSVGSVVAAIGHLLAHGAFKALLFLAAGSVAHAVGSTAFADMGGLRRPMTWTFATATIGFAALSGLVPLSGFFTKDAVVGAAYDAASGGGEGPAPSWLAWLIVVATLFTAVLTVAYATRAWRLVFSGERRGSETAHEAPALMRWPMVVLAVPTALMGLAVVRPGWLAGSEAEPVHSWVAVTSTAILAGVVAMTWLLGRAGDPATRLGPIRPVLAREFGVDAAYNRFIVAPTLAASGLVLATDRDVVDAYARGASSGAIDASRLLRLAQSRNVQTYVTVAVLGIALAAVVAGVTA